MAEKRKRKSFGDEAAEQTAAVDAAAAEQPSARKPPYNSDAERAVLGTIIMDNKAFGVVDEVVSSEDFYEERHRRIYKAAKTLIDQKGLTVNEINLGEELSRRKELERAGGLAYLSELSRYYCSDKEVAEHARTVHDKAMTRKLIAAGSSIVSTGFEAEKDFEEFLAEAEELIFDIATDKKTRAGESIREVAMRYLEEIQQRNESTDEFTGLPAGFKDLDLKTGGFQKSDLIILAARPRVGKTAFALNVALNAGLYLWRRTQDKKPKDEGVIAVFSLEMPASQLVARLFSIAAEIDASKLRSRRVKLERDEWSRLREATSWLTSLPIVIDDSAALNIETIKSRCRKLSLERGLALVVIDYLQLMNAPNETKKDNRERQIAETSRGLKIMARDLKVPVIALSQLNRELEKRVDKHPQLSDLRESGAIEQDADIILFLYRAAVYKEPTKDGFNADKSAELIIAKHRNGPTGKVDLIFDDEFTRFRPTPSEGEDYPQPAYQTHMVRDEYRPDTAEPPPQDDVPAPDDEDAGAPPADDDVPF